MSSENRQAKKVLLHANPRTATLTNKRVLREHVATMTTNLSGDPVAVCWHELSLRVSDVQKLQGPHAINDRIITFYMKHLETKFEQADIGFVAPEDADCMLNQPAWQVKPFFEALELQAKKFVFFVFADETGHDASTTSVTNVRQHFTLVAYSRPEETFYFYEGCGRTQKDASPLAFNFMSELYTVTNSKRFILKMLRAAHLLHSTNHDCGIRTLAMLEHVANHVYNFERIHGIDTLNQNAISDKRMQILTIVHKISESTKAVVVNGNKNIEA